MKTEKRIPTPLELVRFAKEVGIFERFGVSPDIVGFGHGLSFERNEAFFLEAFSRWEEWEYFIRNGAVEWNQCLESDNHRIPLARVLKEVGVQERTLEKYYAQLAHLESWAAAKMKGFHSRTVQEMIQVRDRIAKERAMKAATAKHAKAGKEFKQGK